MASLTRTAVRTQIRGLLAEPTARHYTDEDINTWISNGVRDISIKSFCSTRIIDTALTTTSGITTYAYPADIGGTAISTLGIKSIVTSNNVSLDYVTQEQIGRVAGQGIQNMKWTTWNEKVIFSHAPTATLTLIPYIWIVQDQTGAGTIELPSAYHHIVTLYGVAMGHIKRLEFEAANYIYGMYQQEIDRIVNLINTKYVPEPMKEGLQDQGEAP